MSDAVCVGCACRAVWVHDDGSTWCDECMVAINEYDMVAGHRLDEPAATLGDFTIEFPAGVMRCQLCPVGPGQSRPRAVCSSVETYTLLQFVLAAREHVSEAHTGHRWAP